MLLGSLGGIASAELVTQATDSQILPQEFLNELLILILLGLPLELLQEIALALDLGAVTKVWLSQVITYALARFHVVEEARSILLVGLIDVLVLCSNEGTGSLVPDQVAIACVLCQKSLLLLPRKLIILHFSLVLKLEFAR